MHLSNMLFSSVLTSLLCRRAQKHARQEVAQRLDRAKSKSRARRERKKEVAMDALVSTQELLDRLV